MAGAHRRSSPDLKKRTQPDAAPDRKTRPNPGRTGNPSTDVDRDLLSGARSYSFHQAMRLLRHATRTGKEKDSDIRIRPKLALAFPPGDIDRIDRIENDDQAYFQVTATFLGLYGAASPLPTFYTEDLIREQNEDESVSRDFLDIIHQRLYKLVYQGWLKYRQYLQVEEERNAFSLERLYCLVGLGTRALQSEREDNYQLLRYIGLLTQFPRSAMGLKAMLSDALSGLPLTIIPCVPRMARIPADQQCRMGMSGSLMGLDSYVGEEIEDRMGKLGIRIGPLDKADFLRFTPGNEGYERLVSLTSIYLTDPMVLEVELVLAANQAETVNLGDPIRATLGVTTWVFSEATMGEVRTRFIVKRD